jgi:hypothetical protein
MLAIDATGKQVIASGGAYPRCKMSSNRSAGEQAQRFAHAVGAAVSALAALAWLALSWWHPTLTYHFGPPLAAVAWPIALRARLRRPAPTPVAVAVTGGFLVAMAALGVAVAAHWLRGPTLIGAGSVPTEEVALALIAAAWGWRIARRSKRAWFLPAEPTDADRPPVPPAPRSG